MPNEKSKKTKGRLIGLLAGVSVGSIIALLFAPKSGKELQKDLKTRSNDFIEDVDQYLVKSKDKISQLVHVVKTKSEEIDAKTKGKVDNLLNEAEKLLNEAKNKAGNAVHNGKAKLKKESKRLKTALKAKSKTVRNGKEV